MEQERDPDLEQPTEPAPRTEVSLPAQGHAMARQMDAVAAEAREILQAVRGRQKLDLSSRIGWRELQQATYSERFAGCLSQESLKNLQRLAVKWQRMYQELQFAALTRPVWNT